MIMRPVIKKIRWILLLLFVVVPLAFSEKVVLDLQLLELFADGNLCNAITFYYDDGYATKSYSAKEDMRYVFLPSFADMSRIEVETIADKVLFSKDGEQFGVEKEGREVFSFEEDTPYQVSFLNERGKTLITEQIVFLKSAKLPTLLIETSSGTMERLEKNKQHSEKGFYRLVDTEGNIFSTGELDGISARGNQTFMYEKKSYQIDLKQADDLLDMGEACAWILLSNVYDPSYIRNKLTYDMAVDAGMEGSPRSEFVDVYFNDQYAGMYLLTEKLEFAANRLEYTDLYQENKNANGGMIDKNNTFMSVDRKKKGIRLEQNPEDITGSYLLERDYAHKFDQSASGFTTRQGEEYTIKLPKYASVEEVDYIEGVMQAVEDSIMAPDGIHPVTGRHYTEYIDQESWVDKYLIEEICRNNGGGATSSYFYKKPDFCSDKVFGGPVWDYDKAYGNYHGYNQNSCDLGFLTLHAHYTNWFYHLYQKDDFQTALKQRYRDFYSDYLVYMADEKIARLETLIEDSAKLDSIRYSHIYSEAEYKGDADNYQDIAEDIRRFVRERKVFLDKIWIEEAKIEYIHFRYDGEEGDRTVAVLSGACLQNYPEVDTGFKTLSYWVNEKSGEKFTLDTPVTTEITVVPVWK